MRNLLFILLILFGTSLSVCSQEEEVLYPVNSATSIGIGKYNLLDTYITPGSKIPYTGMGLQILTERSKMTRLANHNISRQHMLHVNFAMTENGAGTNNMMEGLIDYTLGYHYHFKPTKGLKLLPGISFHTMAGFVYGTRVSNNPASGKFDLELNLSGIAVYNFKIKNYPLTARYQFEMPFIGFLFSPHAGQSYYEIFNQGNTSGIFPFTSFHNKQSIRNYLTIDFPVGRFTLRAGYLNSLYYLNVNGIKSHIISNSFTIGFVKEFVAFSGKKAYNKSKHKSVLY